MLTLPLTVLNNVSCGDERDLENDRMLTKQFAHPIPTWLLKSCLHALLQNLTEIVNTSVDHSAYVLPLLKKANLDPNKLKNYRSVSSLQFVSIILEKVVIPRMEGHLASTCRYMSNISQHIESFILLKQQFIKYRMIYLKIKT